MSLTKRALMFCHNWLIVIWELISVDDIELSLLTLVHLFFNHGTLRCLNIVINLLFERVCKIAKGKNGGWILICLNRAIAK